MKKKLISMALALVLVASLSLVPVAVSADPGGDVTIVVYQQDGTTPIEGANVNLFWGSPPWDYMDGCYGRAINPIPAKLTDVNGSATYSAAEIAAWRTANGNPPLFQAKATDSNGVYGVAYTWAVADECPCIAYSAETTYTFTYNLIMFEKAAPTVVWGTQNVTVTYAMGEELTVSGLTPKIGFFYGPLDEHNTDPFQTYPKEGGGYDHYNMIDTTDDGIITVEDYVLATTDGTSMSATVPLRFFDDIVDTIIAVPFLVKTPVIHVGLTEGELAAAEDMYGVGSSLTVGLMTLSSEAVQMTLGVPAPKVSISVSPLTINFGSIYPGYISAPKAITVTNTSPSVAEDITVSVINESRPDFYATNLTIDGTPVATPWGITNLPAGSPQTVEAVLNVPVGTEMGTLTATLVFWAEEATP